MKYFNIIERERNRNKVLSSIINIIKDKELSIADLQRKTGMKRSTLIHYLSLLEKRGFIEKNRIQEKKTGRPTIIKLKKEENKKINKKNKLERKYILEILKEIKKKGKISFEDFSLLPKNKLNDPNFLIKSKANFTALYHNPPLIKRLIILTEEGKKFLKENNP